MSQTSIESREERETRAEREDRRLSSWKEIAAYFGHDQRTVKRWEHSRGLPVRRLPGSRGHVFALVSEVEAWQRGELVAEEIAAPAAAPEIAATGIAAQGPAEGMPETVSQAELIVASETLEARVPEVRESAATAGVDPVVGRAESKRRLSRWLSPGWTLAATVGGCAALLLAVGVPSLARHTVRAEHHRAYVPSPKARELYLQGRFRWSKRTPEDLKAAMEDFQEAVKIDPGYAAAYAGIADAYALGPQFAGQYPAGVLSQMLVMAHKALALDSNLPEGHRALAFAEFYWRWDREGSRAEFEKAIALAPQDAVAHLWYANTLATEGRADQALSEVEKARELNPTEPAIVADRGWVLMKAGRLEEARAVLEALEKTNPENRMAPLWLSQIALEEHRPEEFVAQLAMNARLSGSAAARDRLAMAQQGLRAGGEEGMRLALARLAISQANEGELSPYEAAAELVADGRSAEAVPYLYKALSDRDVSAQALLNPREFAPLRGSPAFQEMLKRLGKPLPASAA